MMNTIGQALDLSSATVSECCRLFHGRGHCYPGLEFINVDWLPPVCLITVYKEVDKKWLEQLVELLHKNFAWCRSVQVQYRCRPNAPFEILWGEAIKQTVVVENSLKFSVNFGSTQNTGLFLDMKNGRQWVLENARDKRVLNLFAYTCGFSVAAISGGAQQVLNIDNNRSVLNKGRENHQLNHNELQNVQFQKLDIFKSWGRLKKQGPYDLLICDPPTYQVGSVNIQRDYKKIIARIPQWMRPDGQLLLCLNSPDLSDIFLQEQVEEHCPHCVFEEVISPPRVFSEAHEGKGLKTILFTYKPGS